MNKDYKNSFMYTFVKLDTEVYNLVNKLNKRAEMHFEILVITFDGEL